MADDKKAKPSSPWNDLWWFIGIMAAFFFLWIIGGGPERAEKENVGPILGGSVSSTPSTSNKKPSNTIGGPTSGEIKVTPFSY